jgi:hypothetical protein
MVSARDSAARPPVSKTGALLTSFAEMIGDAAGKSNPGPPVDNRTLYL